MESIARTPFARFSPRKVNQLLALVRKKSVPDSLSLLKFSSKSCATFVGKTIKSAASNAGDPQAKDPALIVSSAWVGQGPVLKRMRAHAMGRGATYKRKTCHLTIKVSDNKK